MRIVIKKENMMDKFILTLMLLYVMILRWLGWGDFIDVLILCLIVVSMFRYKHYYFAGFKKWIPFGLLVGYSLLNYFLLGGMLINFFKNMYYIMKAVFIIAYFTVLIDRNKQLVFQFVKKCFMPFNLYFIISLPFMLLQWKGWYTSVSLQTLTSGISGRFLEEDYMSGLFGLYGSPQQLVFFIMLVVMNYVYNKDGLHYKSNRMFLRIYNIFLFIFTIWYPLVSENKAYYLFLVMYIFIFILMRGQRKRKKSVGTGTFIKALFAVAVLILLMRIAYDRNELFQSYVDSMISTFSIDYNDLTTYLGGGERIALIFRAMQDRVHTFFGWGLGSRMGDLGTMLNMPHFGQADFGTYITLGGVTFMILLFWTCFLFMKRNYAHKLPCYAMLCVWIAESIYTNLFSNSATLIITMIMYLMIYTIYQKQLDAIGVSNYATKGKYLNEGSAY